MTERSYYWEHNAGGDGNTLSPYSDDEFGYIMRDIVTTLQDRASTGVIYTDLAALNGNLEVTKINDTTVRVDIGAALVNGRPYINDAVLDLTINANGNYMIGLGMAFVAVAAAGDLLDAMTEQTVRAIRLYNAGVAPTMATVQTDATPITEGSGTSWGIPLASFTKAAGVIGTITDERVFLNAETKHMFVQPSNGYNLATLTAIQWGVVANFVQPSISLPAAQRAFAYCRTTIPVDFISDLIVYGVAGGSVAGGNVVVWNYYDSGDCGEEQNATTQNTGAQTEAIGTSRTGYKCHAQLSVSNANVFPGEIVRLTFERNGADINDTAADDLEFVGFKLEYLGYKR